MNSQLHNKIRSYNKLNYLTCSKYKKGNIITVSVPLCVQKEVINL